MAQFTDKVSIITGATSGIGKTTAILLAQRGSKVVIAGRREAEGLAVVKEITDAGGAAIFVKTDVSVESEVENLVSETVKQFGRLDVAFLNSGVFRFSPISDQTSDDLTQQLDINVKGVYYGVKHVSKALTHGGAIVINSSVVADIGMAGASAYSLTKGAVNTLVRTSAVELAGQNIRVNAVSPGPIWTEGAEAMAPTREDFLANFPPNSIPLNRVGETHEIAEAVAFLASDAASFITGQVLRVDGGLSIK